MCDFQDILETLGQEIHLQIKRPSLDVLVVIFEVRIEGNCFILRHPTIMFSQHPRQRGLAASYISCYTYVHKNTFVEVQKYDSFARKAKRIMIVLVFLRQTFQEYA